MKTGREGGGRYRKIERGLDVLVKTKRFRFIILWTHCVTTVEVLCYHQRSVELSSKCSTQQTVGDTCVHYDEAMPLHCFFGLIRVIGLGIWHTSFTGPMA